MVQCIAKRITTLCGLIVVYLSLSQSLSADFFSSAWGDITHAAKKVDNAFHSAAKEVEKAGKVVVKGITDRFKDTKLTRSVDYGVRKAGMETALHVANGVLEAAKQASNGTLKAAEATAQAVLSAAEGFLRDAVQVASPAVLQASADAATATLEGVKQATTGVLRGSEFVVTQVIGQFDITKIRYEGSLEALKKGVLGSVLCEGLCFKNKFSVHFDLDPKDIGSITSSIKPIIDQLIEFFKSTLGDPVQQAVKKLQPHHEKIKQVEKVLSLERAQPNAEEAIQAAEQAIKVSEHIATQENHIAKVLDEVTKKLEAIAQKTDAELKELILQQGSALTSESVLNKQELVKRLRNKK